MPFHRHNQKDPELIDSLSDDFTYLLILIDSLHICICTINRPHFRVGRTKTILLLLLYLSYFYNWILKSSE